jgi:hypothetical protein
MAAGQWQPVEHIYSSEMQINLSLIAAQVLNTVPH